MTVFDEIRENTHLLILWASAIPYLDKIEDDLRSNFNVKRKYLIKWSDEKFNENMGRFYGRKLPSITKKVEHCGKGHFAAYILEDAEPKWVLKNTTSGPQLVNRNLFEAKKRYREITGGGHKVHATNNEAETLRDTSLIFGSSFPCDSNSRDVIKLDLAGAKGWTSLEEFFSVMNCTSAYVVLRNFDSLPHSHDSSLHGDIDILCPEHENFALTANATKVFEQPYRRYHMIDVAGESIPIDIRDVKECYYDPRWAALILENRVKKGSIYVPCKEDYVYSLAYHALVHKSSIADDYCDKLVELYDCSASNSPNRTDTKYLASALRTFMLINDYKFVRPSDWSVFINYKDNPEQPYPFKQFIFAPPRTYRHFKRELIAIAKGYYKNDAPLFIKKLMKGLFGILKRK